MKKPHSKRIGVDFDGVLYPYYPPFTVKLPKDPFPGAVEWFNTLHEKFDEIIIFSTRASSSDALDMMWIWLENHGFDVKHYVDITDKKLGCEVYVDDRGYRFEGTYPSVDELWELRKVWYR